MGLALCVVQVLADSCWADVIAPRLRAALDAAGENSLLPVIIRFRDRADPGRFAQAHRGDRRRALVENLRAHADRTQGAKAAQLLRRGGRDLRTLWVINGLALKLPPRVIRTLESDLLVESVTLDEALPLWHGTAPGAAPAEWNLEYIHAPELWSRGHRGQGVVVATLDTGVDVAHPDLAARWRGGGNSWFDPNGEHATPADFDGHGTWTMGVLVGGDTSGSAIGVAPDATWIAVKIFNDARVASLSAIHEGFQWLLDPDGDPQTDDAPDIVNNSWGFEDAPGVCIGEFANDIQWLRAAGIAVVFAAGNTGPGEGSGVSPANNTGVVSVGAIDNAFGSASFSPRGPSACDNGQFPLFTAPGAGIRTSDRCFGALCDYAVMSGTSLAAPHVAGAMALLLGAEPGATVEQIEAALAQSALDLGTLGPDSAYGHGLIDVDAALDALRCPPGGPDADSDGVGDRCDNCTLVANADQRDSDADGHGNLCDADLNNDGIVNSLDTGIFRSLFLSADADADFNGDGIVNSLDSGILRAAFLSPPGPSADP